MIECYSHIDSNCRSYHGWLFESEEAQSLLSSSVRDSLLDRGEQEMFLEDLAGLSTTGFASERVLADIQAIQEEDPIDKRTWRIGEAFAEVALENHLGVRFHWNELRDTRNPKGNKTGADIVGFIEVNGDVLFLFGETKTSSETGNRPPQVMTGAKQMEAQLKDLYNSEEKRRILVKYLANKTRNLSNDHPFKTDYKNALRNYYLENHPNYQLIGVLIRDIEHDEEDLRASYERLRNTILDPKGIRLIACYVPAAKEKWEEIINVATEK
jgi:hypothetical protein